ncbi:MAG: lysozyme inhibitor LprI family protein [Xanthobacteraceae bacterium]|nr:lysozyme inhibitor LprI family protein [Xanthobacteraceae bacterium]
MIAAAAWVFPAAAAEAAPSTVEACVRGAGNRTAAREACIGRVATACIGPDEGARSDGFIRDCFNSEQQQWDRLLNVAYKTLIQGLEPDRQAKLREMQRAWIDSRERTCNFYYDYFQGSMAYPMIANCMNLETARRAVFLMDIADDFRDRVKQ